MNVLGMKVTLNIDETVVQAYESVSRGGLPYAVFCYDEHTIRVASLGDADYHWDDLMANFSPQDICWLLVNVEYRTMDGGRRSKLCLVRWVPDTLRRDGFRESVLLKQCGIYGEQTLRQIMPSVTTTIQANDFDAVTYDAMLVKASRFERESIDSSWMPNFLQ